MEWIRLALDIMMGASVEMVDYQLQQIFAAVGAPEQYLRLQPSLCPEDVAIDHAELPHLRALQGISQEMAEQNDAKLDAFVKLLMAS